MKSRLVVIVDVILVVFVVFTARHLYLKESTPMPTRLGPEIGMSLQHLNVEWGRTPSHLVVLLREGCSYCEESLAFIRTAASHNPKVQFVPVFSQNLLQARAYLKSKAISDQNVVARAKMPWGTFPTPSFLLCDNQGKLRRVWVGKPTAQTEQDILAALDSH
jgi:hypothetical protein